MYKAIRILKAWSNAIVKDDTIEAEAKRRAQICVNCPFAKHGKILTFVKDSLKEVEGLYCSDCGCPLTGKLRSEHKDDICQKWKVDTKQ